MMCEKMSIVKPNQEDQTEIATEIYLPMPIMTAHKAALATGWFRPAMRPPPTMVLAQSSGAGLRVFVLPPRLPLRPPPPAPHN